MVYKSLYEFIELTKKFQEYKGSLNQILTEIIRILKKKNKTKQDYSKLAFQAPRIIRALVDYKNNHPKDKSLLKLFRDGNDVALKIYKQYDNPKIKDEILKLKTEMIKLGHTKVLKTEIRQYRDAINLIVSNPKFSQKSAERLNKLVGSEKAIMIVIGHGAINVGMDVFLRYQKLNVKKNLLFYPIRFSRTEFKKYEDKFPQLTPDEIKYLKKQGIGKKIIVFDENSYTGKTIKKVLEYLSENVFQHHKINILYNLNTKNLKI
jgi:hypothetical protein